MAKHPLFGVGTTQVGSATVLRLSGELDRLTAPELERALAAAQGAGGPVIVALGDVTYLDMGGIRLLEAAARRAGDQGRPFIVVESPPVVRRVLQIVGFDRTVPMEATISEAVSRLERGGAHDSRSVPPGPATPGEPTR